MIKTSYSKSALDEGWARISLTLPSYKDDCKGRTYNIDFNTSDVDSYYSALRETLEEVAFELGECVHNVAGFMTNIAKDKGKKDV